MYTFFETLQVIGVSSNFEFDVATANPPWMNANEDGVLSVHSKRSRTPVQPDQVQRFEIDQRLRILEDMGMLQVYGVELCEFLLERHRNNVERVVEDLTALGRPLHYV